MAGPDRRITNPPGGSTADPTGGNIIIIKGGVSYNIPYEDFVDLLDDEILLNQLDIADLQTDVTTLQGLTAKNTQLDSAGASWNLPADSCITGIVLYYSSGIGPKVTITSGGDTIMSAKTLNGSTVKKRAITTMYPSEKTSASTITITISDGRADVITFYKTGLTT
jgi:hypothetical protein